MRRISGLATTDMASICHEANRRYCWGLGDVSQVPWDQAPEWQRSSAVDGVNAILDGRVKSPEDSHQNWFHDKRAAGWVYGPQKDPAKKEHPCCVPFDQLPESQRLKDTLFFAIVIALSHEAVP